MASATNVFIGGLPPQVDETALRQMFEPFGAIQSLRVTIDKTTGLSRGHGFVQFIDPAAAAVAISQMNGSSIGDGALLTVKHAERAAGEKAAAARVMTNGAFGMPATAPSDNIYVEGFPTEWTEADLNIVFGACGEIASSVVLLNKTTGVSKGAGLVRFANVAAAMNAVQTLNGSVIEGTGRKLEVKFAERPEDKGMRRAMQVAQQGTGFPQARFSPYGKGGAMPPAYGNGMGAGMGFTADGRVLVPKRKDIMPEDGANLHVFGLDHAVTDLHLYEAFSGYGAIRAVRVMLEPTGGNKGYGFVQFFNSQDAQSAIQALNGVVVAGKPWSISVHKKKGQ